MFRKGILNIRNTFLAKQMELRIMNVTFLGVSRVHFNTNQRRCTVRAVSIRRKRTGRWGHIKKCVCNGACNHL
jgi:hypothetical protein